MTARFVRMLAMAAAVTFAASCSGVESPDVGAAATQTPAFPNTDMPMAPTLEARLVQAQSAALERGADVSISVFDRTSNRYLEVGGDQQIETASVAKLFIAEDLLQQDAHGQRALSDDDWVLMEAMLEASDDNAANTLWEAAGGPDLVTRVAERYSLVSTTAPVDGMWWNTETTSHDLITFYDGILDDVTQLGEARSSKLVNDLRQSTPTAADGYDQRFGLPEALFDEPVLGVKQGWMCCINDRWLHLSTAVVGEDNRYIVAIASREDIQYPGDDNDDAYPDTSFTDVIDDDSALHARDTVTGVTQILFPDGAIDDWSKPQTPNDQPVQEASGR
ncbi:hypothetical protein [Rhodococcus sp. OK302]|uniref:hypothetical protein n=1 Tax=Rhodococcus sp. OK302 TaxID=1882769 RepID=UPI000B940F97|nr:hypothetical protein [Rhodococcus sp. OK302]OYD69412.1 hypothetical protein BDB13_2979 [Rhodococcus sp. OK302]